MQSSNPPSRAEISDKDPEDAAQKNTPPLVPIRQDSNAPQPEEEQQDEVDPAFDYDLLLPPPNPLPKKTPTARDPIQVFYEYPVYTVPKFVGKEQLDVAPSQDINETIKNNNRIYREKLKESKAAQDDDDEESKAYARLCDFFSEQERIIYRRRHQAEGEGFNQTCYNLKTQPKRALETIAIGSDDIQQEENKGKSLMFESRFETGNLAMASIAGDNEYNLILQNDLNTHGFGQWFFFAVTNTKKNQTAKFNILNYRKSTSLHNLGMKVMVYSTKESKKSNIGWTRTTKADYFCNNISRENPKTTNFYRTLSFEHTFKHDSDMVFFAYSQPYTYTDLLDYLDSIEVDDVKSRYFGRSTLCRTIAGNKCELVTITQKSKGNDCEKKKCIFLTARVHPGETHSSYVIQGLMDFLLSNTKEAESLREKFIFKIIPMLNPDGVIHGNSRCSLSGCDLNRKWRKPSPTLHPTIYHAKRLATELNRKYGLLLFCDFHGHSKRRDIFLYGCQEGNAPLETREFAFMLGHLSPIFSYRKSSFFMESYKKGTARITFYQELKIKYAYTLESSFFGPERTGKHFNIEELMEFGGKFCKAICLQFPREGNPTKKQAVKEVEQELVELKKKMVAEFYASQENLVNQEPDSGSESELSEDELPKAVLKELMPKPKKRTAQSPKKTSKSPQRLIKTMMTPIVETKIQKLPSEKVITREKSLPKVSDIKKSAERLIDRSLVQTTKDTNYTTPREEQDPEAFCFIVKRVDSKSELKQEAKPTTIYSQQEPIPLPEPKSSFKSTFEFLMFQEKKEEKPLRTGKERKHHSNGMEIRRPPVSDGNIMRSALPSLTSEKTSSISPMYKQVRSMKEIKSGRDMKILGDNIWEVQAAEEASELKDFTLYESPGDSRDNKFSGNIREEFDFMVNQPVMMQKRKARVPYVLEPLGKNKLLGLGIDNRVILDKGGLKAKKAIRHPGFQRKTEEEGSLYKELVRELIQESPKTTGKSVKDLFGSGIKWDKMGNADKRKTGGMIQDDNNTVNRGYERGFTGMGYSTKLNTQEKDTVNEDMQSSLEYSLANRRMRKVEPIFNQDKKVMELKKPNYVAMKSLDMKATGSLVATPMANYDLSGVKSLNSTTTNKALFFKGS